VACLLNGRAVAVRRCRYLSVRNTLAARHSWADPDAEASLPGQLGLGRPDPPFPVEAGTRPDAMEMNAAGLLALNVPGGCLFGHAVGRASALSQIWKPNNTVASLQPSDGQSAAKRHAWMVIAGIPDLPRLGSSAGAETMRPYALVIQRSTCEKSVRRPRMKQQLLAFTMLALFPTQTLRRLRARSLGRWPIPQGGWYPGLPSS
jgi:hypothetical protein